MSKKSENSHSAKQQSGKNKVLRLILGDQLNASHSWFENKDGEICYLIAELYQETNYVKHHIQKLLAFFASMKNFAEQLEAEGHQVTYLTLDETSDYKSLSSLIASICKEQGFDKFQYQRPDEHRLLAQLQDLQLDQVEIECFETEHFLLEFDAIDKYFEKNKSTRMESFYRKMRKRFDILMDGDEPLSGRWNFDSENRNKLKKDDLQDIPEPLVFGNDFEDILKRIKKHKIEYFGETGDQLLWPVSRDQALQLLEFFCEKALPLFGQFQDSMTAKAEHNWSLYHSRLSYSLNSKMLTPLEVVDRVIEEFENSDGAIELAQVEGFVRQIIGWREFIRGIYWINMPDYAELNELKAKRDLPEFFWTGDTDMHCLKQSIGQSLDYAYAHHIQRLMVIGNFCMLAGIDPEQVDAWYLGVYIDAIEWVEMPNTRGMSQFADGGIVGSKPYSASGSYINRMSDYCSDCKYSPTEKGGKPLCPFNALYWHFMHRHRDKFSSNPRIGMVYRNLDKMDEEKRDRILRQGEENLRDLDSL